MLPFAPSTRWHGTMIDTGLRPTAPPTARAEVRVGFLPVRALPEGLGALGPLSLQLLRERPVARRLPIGDCEEQVPHLELEGRAEQMEWGRLGRALAGKVGVEPRACCGDVPIGRSMRLLVRPGVPDRACHVPVDGEPRRSEAAKILLSLEPEAR